MDINEYSIIRRRRTIIKIIGTHIKDTTAREMKWIVEKATWGEGGWR